MRDRIVVGLESNATRKKLLETSNLTLKKTIDICKSREITTAQMKAFEQQEASVHGIGPSKKYKHRPQAASKPNSKNDTSTRPKSSSFKSRSKEVKDCKYCSKNHMRGECPAFGATCNYCSKENHFEQVCFKKLREQRGRPNTVKGVDAGDSETDYEYESDSDTSTEYINMVRECISRPNNNNINSVADPDIFAEMLIKPNDRPVTFQIDCGAKVNTIPEKYIDQKELITPRPSTLQMWNKSTMKTHGKYRLKLQNPTNGKKYSIDFVVVNDDFTPLLGSKASQQINLITINENNFSRVELLASVNRPNDIKPEEEFAQVFDGKLGCLPGEVHLETDKSIEPTILPPRRLPHAIRPKVKTELENLVERGVIKPVEEPTQWVSQLVVAEKRNKNKDLRICIDPRPLNKALKRTLSIAHHR
jgi:hypothetical protein